MVINGQRPSSKSDSLDTVLARISATRVLRYNAVPKVQDRIPPLVLSGLDAPANLGSGREFIARTNLDLQLGGLGIRGGRLSLYGSYVDTSV